MKKIEDISTSELLSYSTILENICTTHREIQREMVEGVNGGFVQQSEIQDFYDKSVKALKEADEKYVEVQKELDLRLKRDLKLQWGIRKSQGIINEFDAFVVRKNKELTDKTNEMVDSAKKIAQETLQNTGQPKDTIQLNPDAPSSPE